MGWKEAINTYPSSIVYEIHAYATYSWAKRVTNMTEKIC
jgi:hypothetical protein